MQCPACHNHLPAEAKFCPRCGWTLTTQSQDGQAAGPPQPVASAPPRATPVQFKTKSAKAFLVLLIVFGPLATVASFWPAFTDINKELKRNQSGQSANAGERERTAGMKAAANGENACYRLTVPQAYAATAASTCSVRLSKLEKRSQGIDIRPVSSQAGDLEALLAEERAYLSGRGDTVLSVENVRVDGFAAKKLTFRNAQAAPESLWVSHLVYVGDKYAATDVLDGTKGFVAISRYSTTAEKQTYDATIASLRWK